MLKLGQPPVGAALRALIRDEERRAERVVAIVRLAVAAGLAIVFALAVRGTAPADDRMLERQLLLAVGTIVSYAILGLVSLGLSHPRVHRPWFGFLFVTADVGFLVASLELALLNTGLTENFTTALPSAWLVPVILSFGSMRYSPWLQLWATALLLVGLLWLSAPNPVDPALDPVPMSALEAMFAGPPNIMRIAMLALAGLVLALAVVRSRRVLTEALSQERRRQSLTRYMPPEVAALVERAEADELRAGRQREAVVMFVDIRGFTGLTEDMAPDAVSALLTGFRHELRLAVEAHQGIIDKFIGDGAVIVFGGPVPRTDDAGRALACGLEILERLEGWSARRRAEARPQVRAGVGIHRGEVFVGAVGDDARLEFTVVGDTVNVAARVQELTRTVGCDLIATDPVLEAAGRARHEFVRLEPMPVRGRAQPIALWAHTRRPGAAARTGDAAG